MIKTITQRILEGFAEMVGHEDILPKEAERHATLEFFERPKMRWKFVKPKARFHPCAGCKIRARIPMAVRIFR